MKTQNVYIGQHHNPNYGAVYTSIHEAVKEILRPMQEGLVFNITFLPDADRYWIVGVFDPKMLAQDTKWNRLFITSSDAEKHAESIIARGFPKSMVICRELQIHKTGPKTIDIKTEEHASCERQLDAINRAIEIGLPLSNYPGMATLSLDRSEVPFSFKLDPSRYALVDLQLAGFNTHDVDTLWENVSKAAHLLKQVGECDTETQPNKWRRLQRETREFGIRLIGDIPDTGEDVFKVAVMDEAGAVLYTLDTMTGSEIDDMMGDEVTHNGGAYYPISNTFFKGVVQITCRKGAKSHG